jgi:peptidylprolyl isomerase
MKRTSFVVTTLCVIAFLTSACGGDKRFKEYEKTDSGLYYKFKTKNPEGKQPKLGDYLYLTISYHSDNDSITPFESNPIMDILGESKYSGDLYEAYSMLKEGEEADFVLRADSFFLVFGGGQLPPFITSENVLYFTIRLNQIKTVEEIEQEEADVIEKYITDSNITVEPTESGLYYIETLKGKGKKVEAGKKISVHYTGKLLDGTVFDSSIPRGQPLSFMVGIDPMIPGFVEGTLLMNQGGKATIFFPSHLGYGDRGAGAIPPFTPLLFEVEIVEVNE